MIMYFWKGVFDAADQAKRQVDPMLLWKTEYITNTKIGTKKGYIAFVFYERLNISIILYEELITDCVQSSQLATL